MLKTLRLIKQLFWVLWEQRLYHFLRFLHNNKEERDRYRLAQESTRVLSQILESEYNQIIRVENGITYPVIYPKNWLNYYVSCSFYLKYDYIEYLFREFEIVDKINCCIKKTIKRSYWN